MRPRRRGHASLWLGLVALAVVATMAAPTYALVPVSPVAAYLDTQAPTAFPFQALKYIVSAKVTLGLSVGTHYDNFFSVDMGDAGMGPNALAALGNYYNSTPLSVFRFGDGGGSYDPTTNTFYAPGPTGRYVVSTGQAPNFNWFKAWCDSRTPHCVWLVDLPAEENDTTAALHFANWYHKVLGFAPTYWEFGNEPVAWTHYGINMTRWNANDASTPTGLAYATMVRNYIRTISAVYPNDQYLGIQSYCSCDKIDVPPTAQLDGGKVAAMAFHEYPSIWNSTTNLTQFYGSLVSPANVSNSVSRFRSSITSSCTTCSNLPVVIGEYQTGPAGGPSSYALQYPGAPFIAASVIQAIDANVSTFSLFENSWLYSASNGTLMPEGMLYQRILANMTMGHDYGVTVAAGGVGGVFSLLVKNGTRQAFLLVNTNTTFSLRLSLPTTFFPVRGPGETWQWGPALAAPVTRSTTILPAGYLVPAQGILLVTNY